MRRGGGLVGKDLALGERAYRFAAHADQFPSACHAHRLDARVVDGGDEDPALHQARLDPGPGPRLVQVVQRGPDVAVPILQLGHEGGEHPVILQRVACRADLGNGGHVERIPVELRHLVEVDEIELGLRPQPRQAGETLVLADLLAPGRRDGRALPLQLHARLVLADAGKQAGPARVGMQARQVAVLGHRVGILEAGFRGALQQPDRGPGAARQGGGAGGVVQPARFVLGRGGERPGEQVGTAAEVLRPVGVQRLAIERGDVLRPGRGNAGKGKQAAEQRRAKSFHARIFAAARGRGHRPVVRPGARCPG